MVKILRGTIIIIALMMLILPSSVSAQDIAVVREISTALADKGGTIDVRLSFTAPQNLTSIGITETIPDGWNATDIVGNPSAMVNFNLNLSAVEVVWTTIPAGNVYVTYKLHVPDNVPYDDYSISGEMAIGNRTIPIEGDNIVVVSDKSDTMPPVIHSVIINKTDANVYVISNVTDDFRVMSVTANKISLSQHAGDNWVGYIPLEAGTNISVVVVAKDAAGLTATDSSQKFPPAGIRGDINMNNRLDTGDATLILRNIVGLPIPSQSMPILPMGDMNCNNRIDTGDATLVLRDVVGLSIPRCWE